MRDTGLADGRRLVLDLEGPALVRNFIAESAMSDRFFSLLVFLHIGVPLVLLLACGVLTAAVWSELRGEALPETAAVAPATPEQVARGAYLARAGNCMACHTARGGEAYAGGRSIDTPFGTIVAGNLTPDPETGLGRWSTEAFRRALHEGRSRDGHLLYPAFPYTHTTLLSDADVDALYAHLRQLAPVQQSQPAHELRFPYNTQSALALWQLLQFQPQRFAPDAARSAEWNRGAYLVNGLGHCAACHSPRNQFGAEKKGADHLAGAFLKACGEGACLPRRFLWPMQLRCSVRVADATVAEGAPYSAPYDARTSSTGKPNGACGRFQLIPAPPPAPGAPKARLARVVPAPGTDCPSMTAAACPSMPVAPPTTTPARVPARASCSVR